MLSIRNIFIFSIFFITIVMILGGLTTRTYVSNGIYEKQQKDLKVHLKNVATAISKIIDSKTLALQSITNNKELIQELESLPPEAITERTLAIRKLIPDSIGFAFFDHQGNVIGDPKTQRIGSLCRADMKNHVHHAGMHSMEMNHLNPAIHERIPGLEHFDITQYINTSFSNYLVLMSFKLNLIKKTVEDFADPTYVYNLYNPIENKNIYKFGSKGGNVVVSQIIPNTNWELKISAPKSDIREIMKYPLIFFSSIITFILLFSVLLLRWINRLIINDTKYLEKMITSEVNKADERTLKLEEFQDLCNSIKNSFTNKHKNKS